MLSGFKSSDRMIDLIENNSRFLHVISRFGISLGFGDSTIGEVCQRNGVDTATFLAIVNFVRSGYTQIAESPEDLSVATLMGYLRQSHIYFLDFLLPRIHTQLHAVVHSSPSNPIPDLIHRQLDKYMQAVARHMNFEEENLFPYVESLLKGTPNRDFTVTTFSQKHHSLDDSLRELKRILILYNPNCENINELNAVLYQIYECEEELDSHCKAEDYIFVPAVYHLEENLRHENRN